MKVIIAGSRTINDYEAVKAFVAESGYDITEVVSGHSPGGGVDLLGERWSEEFLGKKARLFPYPVLMGVTGGYFRNKKMAVYGDALIAIWDGESKGTKDMINQMKRLGKPHKVFVLRPGQASLPW